MATKKSGSPAVAASKRASVPASAPGPDDIDSDEDHDTGHNTSPTGGLGAPDQPKVKAATATDEEYERHKASVASLDAFVDKVRHDTLKYLETVKGFCDFSYVVSSDWKMFYERKHDRLTTVAIKYENTHLSIKTEKRQLLEKFLREKVIAHIDKFKSHIGRIKIEMGARDTKRKTFEHYTVKIIKLRSERDKVLNKGKVVPSKDIQRIERNEQKLGRSRTEYIEANNNTTKLLRDTWRNRYVFLDPLFAEIVKTESLFMQALSHSLVELQPDLKRAMAIPVTIDPPPASEQPNGGVAAAAPTADPSVAGGERKTRAAAAAATPPSSHMGGGTANLTSPRPPSSMPPPVNTVPSFGFNEPLPQEGAAHHGGHGGMGHHAAVAPSAAASVGWVDSSDFNNDPWSAAPLPSHQQPAPVAVAPSFAQPSINTQPQPVAARVAAPTIPGFDDPFPSFESPSSSAPTPASAGRLSIGFPPSAGGSTAFDPFAPSNGATNNGFGTFGDDPFGAAVAAQSQQPPPRAVAAPPVNTAPAPSSAMFTSPRPTTNPFDLLGTDASAAVPVTPSAVGFGGLAQAPSSNGQRSNPFDADFGAPAVSSQPVARPIAAATAAPLAAPVPAKSSSRFAPLAPLPMLEGAPLEPSPIQHQPIPSPSPSPPLPAVPTQPVAQSIPTTIHDPFGFPEPTDAPPSYESPPVAVPAAAAITVSTNVSSATVSSALTPHDPFGFSSMDTNTTLDQPTSPQPPGGIPITITAAQQPVAVGIPHSVASVAAVSSYQQPPLQQQPPVAAPADAFADPFAFNPPPMSAPVAVAAPPVVADVHHTPAVQPAAPASHVSSFGGDDWGF